MWRFAVFSVAATFCTSLTKENALTHNVSQSIDASRTHMQASLSIQTFERTALARDNPPRDNRGFILSVEFKS